MKKLFSTVLCLFFMCQLMAQSETPTNQKPKILLILKPLIQNEEHKIKPEIWTGPFMATYKDSQRDYKWHEKNIGIRTSAILGIFFIYNEIFYSDHKSEYFASPKSIFEKHQEFDLEFGYGIKIPVEIGETGIKAEGELTSLFGEFRPALEIKFGWINKKRNLDFTFGNKVIVTQASLFNPTATMIYKLY